MACLADPSRAEQCTTTTTTIRRTESLVVTLDPVGRAVLDQRELSRAAARRFEQLEAVRARRRRPSPPRAGDNPHDVAAGSSPIPDLIDNHVDREPVGCER